MYSELKPERIQETIVALERRIAERFPGSSLSRVSSELRRLAGESEQVIQGLRRPMWLVRFGAALAIVAIVGIAAGLAVLALSGSLRVENLADVLQASEAAVNEIILLALTIFFLITLETRVKRRKALRALHRLRSIVHIVDMHQLTKDPEYLVSPKIDTPSSPARSFTRFELSRYLDYCSELLSLTSKLAALYVQYVNDPVVLTAVNDIETLATSLSNKVWQKIVILDVAMPEEGARSAATE